MTTSAVERCANWLLPPGGFYHGSLSRTAVHYKRSTQGGRRVGRRNAEQIAILIQRLMMLRGIGSSRH